VAPNAKRIVAGVILTVIPIVCVYQVKQTTWGTFMATPKARQKGDLGAPVLIVEYSDFQCPMCASIQPDLKRMLDSYVGKVRLAFKHFPLTRIHKNAMPAATAAECAARQDKFWPYQDRLFQTQHTWAALADPTTVYMALAREVRLDVDRFRACYADPATETAIALDRKEGLARQIGSTPTVFIGDERLVGPVIQTDGARMIERELRRKK